MPTYVPNNIYVFEAAYNGALSGFGVQGNQAISPTASHYAKAANVALAFAESFDTAWGVTAPDLFEHDAIQSASSAYWLKADPFANATLLEPATFNVASAAIIALIDEAETAATALGISFPTYPPGGGGGGGNATEFQSVPIAVGPPSTASEVYVSTGPSQFILRQLTQDDILPGFAITGFSVSGGTVEVGSTVTNPTVTASYNEVPVSANVTNTDGVDSPLDLTSPFTSGTITGSFTSAVVASVNATLSATNSASVTKTDTITFLEFAYRTFSGVGTAGATSATASGNNATLNGGAGTLPNAGLFPSGIVGQSFVVNPSAQNVYILTEHTATPHTWKDLNTGFSFAMNAPITFTFVNQYGISISYDLYQSTNALGGSYDIEAVT